MNMNKFEIPSNITFKLLRRIYGFYDIVTPNFEDGISLS